MTDERRKYEHKLQKCSHGWRGSTRRRWGAMSIARTSSAVCGLPSCGSCIRFRRACARASPDVFYGVLNVLAKPGFGARPLWGHRNIGILPSFIPSPFPVALSPVHTYIHTYHQPANADLPTRANRHARSRPPRPRRSRGPQARREDGRLPCCHGQRRPGRRADAQEGENGASNGAGNGAVAAGADAVRSVKPGADAEGKAALAARWMGWGGLRCLLWVGRQSDNKSRRRAAGGYEEA
jgi:hypothetical protein